MYQFPTLAQDSVLMPSVTKFSISLLSVMLKYICVIVLVCR